MNFKKLVVAILVRQAPVASFADRNTKFCVHCKHMVSDDNTDQYSRCSLFTRKADNSFLVNGIREDKPVQYYHCTTARSIEAMCGQQGKRYEELTPPVVDPL